MTYGDFVDLMYKAHGKNINGYIVFDDKKSWGKEYPLESKTYVVNSDCKAFDWNAIGSGMPGSSLDGTDIGVRLDWYLKSDHPWKVAWCYFLREDGSKILGVNEAEELIGA